MDLLPVSREQLSRGQTRPTSSVQDLLPQQLIDLAIESHITHLSKKTLDQNEPFFIADLGQVTRQHQRWKQNLPQVHPYYAVKCNSDPKLLKCLADLGTGFDCASIEEMHTVLSLGVDPALILFANPCKSSVSLDFARRAGILRTTFDNLDELEKIKLHMPNAELLLRIYASDDSALISLGDKFGAHLDTASDLISLAWRLQLNLVGVSFHVGTGASDPAAFCHAIRDARKVFVLARRHGFHPTILDIGGGFQDASFDSMASIVAAVIREEMPSGITVIAEPGRYYASSAYTLISQVIARRRQIGKQAIAGTPDMLYQNDGVYGNFMNVIMEKERMVPALILGKKSKQRSLLQPTPSPAMNGAHGSHSKFTSYRYSIWGPTCDSIDCVARDVAFHSEVNVGDWLVYKNMGAYTMTTASRFNGFNQTQNILYVNSETMADFYNEGAWAMSPA